MLLNCCVVKGGMVDTVPLSWLKGLTVGVSHSHSEGQEAGATAVSKPLMSL